MKSLASSVDQYLSELPDERRTALEAVRQVILENLPAILLYIGSHLVEFHHLKCSRISDVPADQPLSMLTNSCHYLFVCLVTVTPQ